MVHFHATIWRCSRAENVSVAAKMQIAILIHSAINLIASKHETTIYAPIHTLERPRALKQKRINRISGENKIQL